ncbi:MAG: glutathione synthetase [Phycisphaerae bacterium]
MRIGFFVNSMKEEAPRYATTQIAYEAFKRGHEVWYIDVEGFSYQPNDEIHVHAVGPSGKSFKSFNEFLASAKDKKAKRAQLDVAEFDVVMLRNDPAADATERPWASTVGIVFGQEVARRGVLVLNDPVGLSGAMNKLYFQRFPEEVRPKTLISKDSKEIKAFVDEQKSKVVIKPLQGSGGQSVFLIRKDEGANVNQMIEAVSRDGYVIAQEYIPAAANGDTRFFIMNGEPLAVKGKFAAIQRIGGEGDMRSNMHRGGKAEKAALTDDAFRIAELVRPMLVHDGMFLVGLDIVGKKLLEINVFSPGGLYSCEKTQGVKFTPAILDAIERKLEYAARNPGVFKNVELATL